MGVWAVAVGSAWWGGGCYLHARCSLSIPGRGLGLEWGGSLAVRIPHSVRVRRLHSSFFSFALETPSLFNRLFLNALWSLAGPGIRSERRWFLVARFASNIDLALILDKCPIK
jgi:hypothetical protein